MLLVECIEMKMKNSKMYKICLFSSLIALGLLVAPATPYGVAVSAICAVLVFPLLWKLIHRLAFDSVLNKRFIIYDLLTAVLLGLDFCDRWTPSRKIAGLAQAFHVSKLFFVNSSACLMALLSLIAIDGTLSLVVSVATKKLENPKRRLWLKSIVIALVVLLQYYSLGISSIYAIGRIVCSSIVASIANVGILFLFSALLCFFLRKWNRALFFSSSLAFLWSLANYYTIQFHGSPLYLSEFSHVQTAAAVVANYRFRITAVVFCIFLLFLAELKVIRRETSVLNDNSYNIRKIRVWALRGACVIVIFLCGIVSINQFQNWRPWDFSVDESGFVICAIEDLRQRANPVEKPDGYASAWFDEHSSETVLDLFPDSSEQRNPDFILILNETLCDLSQYSSIATDVDPLSDLHVQGSVVGNGIVPSVGGGTNNTEFELLTSKSMLLLKSYAPFTYLSGDQLGRSTVHYLRGLGYQTLGMHCGINRTYSRNIAYPQIGFDTVVLGPDMFQHFGKNGHRSWLDADNYRDLIDHYEKMGEGPRLVYLLTMQNHGGYEQNDASLDTVHVQADFGDLTDDLDEYLSSVELSAKAFRGLTDYFSKSDRNVIICMVGDHAPSFISSLPSKPGLSLEESEIAKRTVPYVIWANFPMELPAQGSYISTVDLLPVLMNAAGMPMPPFYQCVLRLHEEIPVRTSSGLYRAPDGTYAYFSLDDPQNDLLKQYYYMEYNSLLEGDEYRRDLFECR